MTLRHGLGLSMVLAAMVCASGCTGGAGGGAADRPTVAPAATSMAASGFGTRTVALGCADAVGASAADTGGRKLGDPPFDGFIRAETAPPRAEDVGLRLPDAQHWYFRKQPLVLLAGEPSFTITVSAPGQALAWVPGSVWTSGGEKDLTSWAARSVTLSGCPDRAALFTGGVLAADLDTCLSMTVRSTGRAARAIRQQLDGSPCR